MCSHHVRPHRVPPQGRPPVSPQQGVHRPRARHVARRLRVDVPAVDRGAGGLLARADRGPRVARAVDEVLGEWKLPKAKFFVGARLNITESCLDRHVPDARAARRRPSSGRASRATPARSRTSSSTGRSCASRRRCSTSASARATASPSTWAWCPRPSWRCSRARASGRRTRSSSAGSAPDALRDRINDCGAKVLLTQDGAWRRGNVVPLKKMADAAVEQTPEHPEGRRAQAHRTRARAVVMKEGRDIWWDDLLDRPAERGEPREARRSPTRSTPSTRSSSSTRRGPRASPRASSTRRPGTSPACT